MTLPPLWKVNRELERIGVKAVRLAGRWVHDPIRNPIYDMTAGRRQTVTPGAYPLTGRVAVFVVYQPKGVAASILLTLEHLRQNDYSVLVVSNGPLRPEDRALLAENAAIVLERPNVGYDFGAYRDGIRHLWALKADLSRLILMNDSTWFPLRREDDSLARMEALGADLAGHVFKTEEKNKRGIDHVESHLLMISREFYASRDFLKFWSNYRMSDNRTTTIKYGEKGFSNFAIRHGWSVKALLGRDWFATCLKHLGDDDISAVLTHTVDGFRTRMKNADFIRSAASRGEAWRQEYIEWAHDCLSNTTSFGLSGTFIMPAVVYGGLGFAKKGRETPFHHARLKLLELDRDGVIPPLDETVRNEVTIALSNWGRPQEASMIRANKAAQTLAVRN